MAGPPRAGCRRKPSSTPKQKNQRRSLSDHDAAWTVSPSDSGVPRPSFGSSSWATTPSRPSAIAASSVFVPPPAAPLSEPNRDRCHGALVLDSGPIIRRLPLLLPSSSLPLGPDGATPLVYVTPGVLNEIRDEKSRRCLEEMRLRMTVVAREPSEESRRVVRKFGRMTGDASVLSDVDVGVCALAYEIDVELNSGSSDHIRSTPKRVLGKSVQSLNPSSTSASSPASDGEEKKGEECQHREIEDDHDSDGDDDDDYLDEEEEEDGEEDEEDISEPPKTAPKSWAHLLGGSEAVDVNTTPSVGESDGTILHAVGNIQEQDVALAEEVGQFSDPDDDDDDDDNDDEGDPLENPEDVAENEDAALLNQEFPTLQAIAAALPTNDDVDASAATPTPPPSIPPSRPRLQVRGEFRDLLSQRGIDVDAMIEASPSTFPPPPSVPAPALTSASAPLSTPPSAPSSARVPSALAAADDVLDDGTGWIDARSLALLRAEGTVTLDSAPPARTGLARHRGPPPHRRCACATTDFAMQNLLLQMGLVLMGSKGRTVRKVRTWMLRCSGCFDMIAAQEKRSPFCPRCGADALQKVSVATDGRTGRMRVFLNKARRARGSRGTKFSLPAPGKGDRFKGDIVLREDQMLTGIWAQKQKRMQGAAKTEACSIFGADITGQVGLTGMTRGSVAQYGMSQDIKVGLGRSNPNATKFGRERRGKKKKGEVGKACGMRRY